MIVDVPLAIGLIQVTGKGPCQEAFDLADAGEKLRKSLDKRFGVVVAELGALGLASPTARIGRVEVQNVIGRGRAGDDQRADGDCCQSSHDKFLHPVRCRVRSVRRRPG
jgi:hypothetical protein